MDYFTKLPALLHELDLEARRCDLMQDAWASVDSEVADGCHFDAGALYACKRILMKMQRREDILADIEAMVKLISHSNNQRWEQ
jgi:hypothetical protein